MKIETTLLNAVRFPVLSGLTKLHVHTGNVVTERPTLLEPDVGPRMSVL